MFIAKVTGSVIATQKVDTMVGHRLLVVEPYRLEAKDRKTLVTTGRTFVAVDMLGSGVGDFVLITQGSSARLTAETKSLPIDCVVIGIVDRAHVDSMCIYDRTEDDAQAAVPKQEPKPKAKPAPVAKKEATPKKSEPKPQPPESESES
ncbi:EutN/CcmL family microcompartment protein [Blastopirellula marina]|uniref:Ethanolamine utilization protein EutN n=1 Tax=Blastopirellula marina TaxID=124 RepID=A0A2S8G1X4_9BACT|nr:EutN/CcmL family microcompartment protein [Blastopirellula marina]PQO38271.1 ethanolamine utilization protein EutN [Blastopirellula marina]PTL44927.1 ethanolamine utilization protein EutN [Blastopirellula marina]